MSFLDSAPGFYGKLPSLGDFVFRRLPAGFIQSWDGWIQGALTMSRKHLGSDWLDVYLTSPIWRFALSPGACGDDAWAGVMMPSIDRVGRYFPLTLAASIRHHEALPWLFIEALDWFERLERLALSALEDGFSLWEFDEELKREAMAFPCKSKSILSAAEGLQKESGQISFRITMGSLAQVADALIELSACLLAKLAPAYSLWGTNGSERVKPSVLVYGGLPPFGAFTGFMTGNWSVGESASPDLQSVSLASLDCRALMVPEDRSE